MSDITVSDMAEIDAFTDPVAFLGAFGIECELVATMPILDEAA